MAGTGPAWGLRLSSLRYRFRESLFLLPALVVLGGILLALVGARVDAAVEGDAPVLGLSLTSHAATWLLSTVAGAMITTAGVVFSLTVVSLQLASSQFSPRVMRSFIRDRVSQLVIGLLVATFVYCVLTLANVREAGTEPAPPVSMGIALVLTLVTVVSIIAHLDHLARRLQVGQVVRDISMEGQAVVRQTRRQAEREVPGGNGPLPVAPDDALTVRCTASGWVSQVGSDLVLAAVPEGTTVRLETRVGAYLHRGEALVTLWPVPSDPDRTARRLRRAVVVSDTRTMQEDVDFAIRQLVDVGLRALSAAINDPSTAVEVVLRVGSLMRELLVNPPLSSTVHGPGDRVLVRPWLLTPEEYVEHAFDQLRQTGVRHPQVAGALLRVLRMLALHLRETGHPEYLPAIVEQQRLVLDAVRADPALHPADRDRLLAMARDETDPADHSRHGPH